jgi:hypothetical protein
MERQLRSVGFFCTMMHHFPTNSAVGIVGPPAHHLLGVEGVEGAQGPRFRKLSPQEIEDYLTNL